MRRLSACSVIAPLVLGVFQFPGFIRAQASAEEKPLMLVTWFGPGAITLPSGGSWKPAMLTVYDNTTRPVAQFTKDNSAMTASFILFENRSGTPSAEGCRKDAIDPILVHGAKIISKREDGETEGNGGVRLATTSYRVDMSPALPGHFQRNLFAFAGNDKTCAEMHVSAVRESADADANLKALLADFHFDLGYKPTAIDYFRLASILFHNRPGLSAPYYKSSLDAMPKNDTLKTPRRIATDQLVMALGMSGDLKNSRAVAEMAIKSDPDYPINYYNLACADAEGGDAAQAKIHLQQAFDRRANVLKGESMPDPTKDDSILKLKKDKEFWDWVQTLPKS